jgi:hypothetical protein
MPSLAPASGAKRAALDAVRSSSNLSPAAKDGARRLSSRERRQPRFQLFLLILRTLIIPHRVARRENHGDERDQRVIKLQRGDRSDEQPEPPERERVQRKPKRPRLPFIHPRHPVLVPRLEPPPRLPAFVDLVPKPQPDEQASRHVLRRPEIHGEEQDARDEVLDEIRVEDFTRAVRDDGRRFQDERRRERDGVFLRRLVLDRHRRHRRNSSSSSASDGWMDGWIFS